MSIHQSWDLATRRRSSATRGKSRSCQGLVLRNPDIALPSNSPVTKISGTRRNRATVILAGADPLDREIVAKQINETTGATLVGPIDDQSIVLDQAIATLEMVQQVNEMCSEDLD